MSLTTTPPPTWQPDWQQESPPRKPFWRQKKVAVPGAIVAAFLAFGLLGAAVGPPPETDVRNPASETQLADQAAAAKAVADKAAAAAAAEQPTVDFAMPNLVGANLQVAQNTVQQSGIFYSVSHDLLGMRMQMMDSNWQVCDQTPAAGTRITGPASDWEGRIDFGVVKLTETCP